MLLIPDNAEIPHLDKTCGLTIGNFDGVHLGHQALLQRLRKQIGKDAPLVVFTFSNHPSHLFTPHSPTGQIYPAVYKVKLLESYGVDLVLLVPFTQAFAQIPFDDFLSLLMKKIPFSHLFLGKGAAFGKKREGNEEKVRALADQMGFEVDYLEKITFQDELISSKYIRKLIAKADFARASQSLGRPYSLMGHVKEGIFVATGLCLPPDGNYSVKIKNAGITSLTQASISSTKQEIQLNDPVTAENIEIYFLY